jgi:hypothetical protein
MSTIIKFYRTIIDIIKLPVANLRFHGGTDRDDIVATYRYYTKWHPRYKVIRHKTLGAALIDLTHINTREKYLALIKGKRGADYHAKRARARGYIVSEIERNDYIDAIHEINISCASRQGRAMDATYQRKIQHFDAKPHFRYFGVVDPKGKLVAYANIGAFGNFCAFSHLIGVRNNDGIMHFLLAEIIFELIDRQQAHYVMYDTFFGALPGLRQFKTMLGFRPYRVKYILQ